jgi:signal transduction histidine kinase
MQRVPFRHSISATLASAQSALVVVLIAISVVATVQFGNVAELVSVTSDDAEAWMHLTHALDSKPDTLRAFQDGYGEDRPDAGARTKFSALLEDLKLHVARAQALVATEDERAGLREVSPTLVQVQTRASGLDKLGEDDRAVAQIELEEALGDMFAGLDKTKLLASEGLEHRLATVKTEVRRPVRMFWGAAALGGLIALVVSLVLRKRVSHPIGLLSRAVGELAQGRATHIDVASRDEIGVLGGAFNEMAATITERTRSLKLVFDSVGEGLLTCDRAGKLVSEPSARALEWFGTPSTDATVAAYLAGGDTTWASYFSVSFDQLVEGMLPFELCADQMPAEVTRGARIYELKFRPVLEDGEFRRVLVIAADVTEQRAMARKEREARDVYALSSFALRDPGGYSDFVKEVAERLARARRGVGVMIELHTVKGSAGVIGCDYFADAVHDCESHMLEQPEDAAPIATIQAHFQSLRANAEKAVGSGDNDSVVVRRHEYHQLLSLLQVTEAGLLERARHLARSWSMHRIGSSFERLAKTGVRSAERQGKSVVVQLQGDQICVPKGPLDDLWSTLTHLVRNAVAHGIEPTQERLASGKSAEGRIMLRAHVEDNTLKLRVSDDGRGIDWDALARKFTPSQRPSNDNRVELLFREGASTAESVSDLAGRGVGMSAVQSTVLALGGTIDVESTPGQGTSVVITVPVGSDVYVPAPGVSLLPAYRSKIPARPSTAAAR